MGTRRSRHLRARSRLSVSYADRRFRWGPSGYGLLFRAAVVTLPEEVREVIGVRARPGDLEVGRVAVRALRWALGASPDWDVALRRTGASPPPGVHFRQPLRSPVPPLDHELHHKAGRSAPEQTGL